jgi:hypothetical protein
VGISSSTSAWGTYWRKFRFARIQPQEVDVALHFSTSRARPSFTKWVNSSFRRGRDTSLALVSLVFLAACGAGDGKASAQPQPGSASPTGTWSLTPVIVDMGSTGYCPSPTFYQVPGHPDLFLGRTVDATDCTHGPYAFTLALFRMDWPGKTLHFTKSLLPVPTVTPSGIPIKAAFDPTAVEYRGEIWVAFVCVAGFGDNSSCVAPLDLQSGLLDLSRLSVPARGLKSPFSEERFSAGVPKLFIYNDRLYMYWSVVDHFPRAYPGAPLDFRSVTARGAELAESAEGVMVITGAPGGYVGSTDDGRAVRVMSLRASDPTANSVADIYDVKVINGKVLVAAAIGGVGSSTDEVRCVQPLNKSLGCYHLEIHQGTGPLGTGVFDRKISGEVDLPYNPVSYAHFVVEPDGQVGIIGTFYRSLPQDQTHQYGGTGTSILTSPALR